MAAIPPFFTACLCPTNTSVTGVGLEPGIFAGHKQRCFPRFPVPPSAPFPFPPCPAVAAGPPGGPRAVAVHAVRAGAAHAADPAARAGAGHQDGGGPAGRPRAVPEVQHPGGGCAGSPVPINVKKGVWGACAGVIRIQFPDMHFVTNLTRNCWSCVGGHTGAGVDAIDHTMGFLGPKRWYWGSAPWPSGWFGW